MSRLGKEQRRRWTLWRSSGGWILLEVMVAVLVIGILLGPLAGAVMSAAAQAARVRGQANHLAERSIDAVTMGAWTWGALAISAAWLPGPELQVSTGVSGEAAGRSVVGLWIDGWFQGEWSADSFGLAVIEAETWSYGEGCEAVVRVRAPGDAWGPPWRSLVPGLDGAVALAPPTWSFTPSSGETVIHPPNASNPGLDVSWTLGQTPELSLPIVFEAPAAGPVGVTIDESAQSWLMDVGRGLDIYF